MNFIQQAYKGKTDFWRYALTLFFTFFGWQIVGAIPLLVTAVLYAKDIETFQKSAANNFMDLGIPSSLYLFMVVFTFATGLIFLLIGVKQFLKRSIKSVLTSRANFDWNRFFTALVIWTIITTLFIVIDYFQHPQDFTWNFQWIPFLLLAFVSIFFIPLQTSLEEVLFRGFFLQGIGIVFKNRWIPLLFTSVIFGLLHWFNPEMDKLGALLMIYYIGTGLFFGIITLMDEGLEISLGLHAANNITASLLVTTNWTVFQTDAVLIDHSEPTMGWMVWIPLLLIYPTVLFIFYKIYRWTDWKEKLVGRIDTPDMLYKN